MPRVLILDHQVQDVIRLEDTLKNAGYEVTSMIATFGILAKFDFEKPDIFLFNPDMPNTDTDALLATLTASNSMKNMVIVLICDGDAGSESIAEYCKQMQLNGYYMKAGGFAGIVDYLKQFYR